MTGWTDAAQLATAGGTLVLAVATFQSVRSANRAARVAELSMQMGLQPVLVTTRPEDPPEQASFLEGHIITAPGGGAAVEERDGNLFVVIPLRNVGAGLAVLRSGHVADGGLATDELADKGTYRELQRDLYVPPGDRGFWQIGVRSPEDPFWAPIEAAVRDRGMLLVTLYYTDHQGGHRSKTRFVIRPTEDGSWQCAVTRHWGIADRER